MQDIATKIVEKAVAAHDWMAPFIVILTITACWMSGAIGYVVLYQTMEVAESWLREFAGVLYAVVLIYWEFRLALRLISWARETEKARITDASRQAEVNR
jgi:hypothetical protein